MQYLAWWQRLRNVTLDGIKTDEKLLREYTFHMDKKAVQKSVINKIASSAVYEDNLDTDFIEDLSDFLADISDNQAHKMGVHFTDESGNKIENVSGELVRRYDVIKAKKELMLKNRKKGQDANDRKDNK